MLEGKKKPKIHKRLCLLILQNLNPILHILQEFINGLKINAIICSYISKRRGTNINNILVTIEEYKKGDSGKIDLILQIFNPLISKYANMVTNEESEDIRQELRIAIWESLFKMKYFDNEGEVVKFISNAVRYRFYELIRKYNVRSKHEIPFDLSISESTYSACYIETDYDNICFTEDIMHFVIQYPVSKRKIVFDIIMNKKDSAIAIENKISRQYVNRIRRELYDDFRKFWIEP